MLCAEHLLGWAGVTACCRWPAAAHLLSYLIGLQQLLVLVELFPRLLHDVQALLQRWQ
jgi:hypothetical protein